MPKACCLLPDTERKPMDIIHLLPDSVANQIAAGEVIQRPASCLKELVENSLDAGATRIQILVRDAGRTLLQVVDNGSGMSSTDARMAFERHATSKIKDAADLFALRTMGFRGEALASICAVAQVELTTRCSSYEIGTRIEIAGSEVLVQEPCQCPVGTSIKVKNIFFNVPVRRRFLKTDQTELRNLLSEFYRIALVYPKVHFTFANNDEVLHELPVGTEKQRIEALFGKGSGRSYTSNLIDIKTDTDLVSIRGFVSKPEATGRAAQQYFFVNGRYMRHPYFQKAVTTAYAGMLLGDYQPSFFIYFDIDPQTIDVNIHPTKTEIKFADEQTIFPILLASVREALGKFSLAPVIDFNQEGALDMPIPTEGKTPTAPKVVYDPTYNPFRAHNGRGTLQEQVRTNRNWETLYSSPHSSVVGEGASEDSLLSEIDIASVSLWQYGSRYIFIPTRQGVLAVDQHRAHVCVLYEQYMSQMAYTQGASQQLLFPEVLDLSAEEMLMVASLAADLRKIGFDMNQFSKNSYSINGIPAQLESHNVLSVLQHILQSVREADSDARQEWQKRIALSIAKDSAIPCGKELTQDEMRDLIERLFRLASYRFTPDGKPVAVLISDEEINKRF